MNPNLFSAQSKCVAVSATTAASTPVALPNAGNTIRIVNEGPNTAYISVAATATPATIPTATAATTCTPVTAGSDVTLGIPCTAVQFFSAITATGTAALDVQVGEGM